MMKKILVAALLAASAMGIAGTAAATCQSAPGFNVCLLEYSSYSGGCCGFSYSYYNYQIAQVGSPVGGAGVYQYGYSSTSPFGSSSQKGTQAYASTPAGYVAAGQNSYSYSSSFGTYSAKQTGVNVGLPFYGTFVGQQVNNGNCQIVAGPLPGAPCGPIPVVPDVPDLPHM